jgi:amino acid adenylation domain-containing protein
MNLIDIFEKSRELYGEQTAIKGDGFSYTYEVFGQLVNRFAGSLFSKGLSLNNPVVGICMERSPELLIGIFGILRCGAAYLPIDPKNPPKRNASILNEASVEWVATTPDLVEAVTGLGFKPIVPETFIKEEEPLSFPTVDENDTAYILFTSGSTGDPKGVMIRHHSVVNLLKSIQELYPLVKGDVVLLKSPYTFDGSIWEIFGWMIMGGCLYILAPGEEKDPQQLTRIILNERIAFCFFVPSMLSVFVDYFRLHKSSNQPPALKWVSVGGEVLSLDLVNRFYSAFSFDQVKLINVYGPTETTVYATTHVCSPDPYERKVPLGKPLLNVTIHILDKQRKPVAALENGEICIGGEGVGIGYLHQPELTLQRFISSPFDTPGYLYCTGDIGRINESGLLEFLGREDFQVKLRGLRIELGEIEYALNRLEEVKESIVLMRKDHQGDDCLVAYIQPTNFLSFSAPYHLAEEGFTSLILPPLRQWLPSHMIPSFFIICQTLPLTLHEKIDRNALPPLTTFLQKDLHRPFTTTAEVGDLVMELWKRVLGLHSFGRSDDFFELGGHSIKAIQLITMVMKEFQVEIPLKDFYNGITVEKMAEGIEQNLYPATIKKTSSVQLQSLSEFMPLVPTQREMWILHNFDSTGLIHNIQVEFTLLGFPDI